MNVVGATLVVAQRIFESLAGLTFERKNNKIKHMANKSLKGITLPQELIKQGIAILPLEEYRKLCKRAIPTYYLTGKEAEELDKLVEEGLKEYREGETVKASSLREAMELYEQRGNKKP